MESMKASPKMPRRAQLVRRLFGLAGRQLMGTITHVSTREPVAALTFDDGPHPEFTPLLLEILERHRVTATFFMVGEAAQQYPDLVRRVAEAGHTIGNHSWNHPSFPLITRRERRRQLLACQKALAPYGQRIFRPPYVEQSFGSRLDALSLGYKVIAFSVDVGDWHQADAHRMADLLSRRVRPGSVVILHDALFANRDLKLEPKLDRRPYDDRRAMLLAVEMFLDRVGHQLHFVSIPELLRLGRPQRQHWYRMTRPA